MTIDGKKANKRKEESRDAGVDADVIQEQVVVVVKSGSGNCPGHASHSCSLLNACPGLVSLHFFQSFVSGNRKVGCRAQWSRGAGHNTPTRHCNTMKP